MDIKRQDNIRKLLEGISIPNMARVSQRFEEDYIPNPAQTTAKKLRELSLSGRIGKGMRVVLTGSSRYISDAVPVLRETAAFIKECGAEPYIIPAMGSHGGATAEGQKHILESYGITESNCGCRIYSSLETVCIGHTDNGIPVYIDKFAAESDAIIPIGRIKAHTAFRGNYESGLMKMLAIGLGKQKGADSLHEFGFGAFPVLIPAAAQVVLKACHVPFGVGIIENAFDRTCRIEVLYGEGISAKEPELLQYAKARMARILLPETDVLVVCRVGKDISGSGMDPNITGTWSTPYISGGFKKKRVVILDLTNETNGNAVGIGRADVISMKLFHKIDFAQMYPNLLTSRLISNGSIPMVLEDDEMAIKAAIKILDEKVDKENPRIVIIKDTLHLSEIIVSEALLPIAERTDGMKIISKPKVLQFDTNGHLINYLNKDIH